MKFGYTIIYVASVEDTLAFYQQAFSFDVKFLHESKAYGELETGETTLAFASHDMGEMNLGRNYLKAKISGEPFGIELAFVTDDVPAAFDKAVAAGAIAFKEPEQKPWGQVVAYVRAVDGSVIELCSPISGQPAVAVENIKNFVQLTPTIATSGQPTEKQFRAIALEGYEVVINLAMPEHCDAIDNEGQLVTGNGMAYFHIPVPFDHPTPEHVRLFCELMNALKDKKIWVHCIMNYRVAAFMFHYLHKVEGWAESESISPIFKIWKPDRQWQEILSLSSDEIGFLP